MSGRVNSTEVENAFSLMNELQTSFYKIARMAELGEDKNLKFIISEAETAMKIIDVYRQCAMAELGQTNLEFGILGAGSMLYDVAMDLKKQVGCSVDVQSKTQASVGVNPTAVKNILFSLSYFLARSGSKHVVFGCSKSGKDKIELGVFAKDFYVTKKDLEKALKNKLAYMPLSKTSYSSAVFLLLANMLAKFSGSNLMVKKTSGMRGFVILVPKSEQLQLV